MRFRSIAVASALIFTSAAFAGPAWADAAPAGSAAATSAVTSTSTATAQTTSVTNSACVQQVNAAYAGTGSAPTASDLAQCTITVTTSVDPEVTSTAADINDQASLRLNTPDVASTIHSQTWSQEMCSGGLVNVWCEYHSGKTYYNGTKAWTTHAYRGRSGRHTCHAGGSYTVGWAITVGHCTDAPDGSSDLTGETFDVGFVVKGSPVSFTEQMGRVWKKNGTWTWVTSY